MLGLLQQPGTWICSCPPRAGEELKKEAKKQISPYLHHDGCEPRARSPPRPPLAPSYRGGATSARKMVYIQPRPPRTPPG